MATFSINGVLQASYKYDFAGRQVVRALSGGATIHSVFDADCNRIAEYDQTSGALIREYVWFDGAAIAVIEGGVVYYIRSDHIGRPVFATNGAGVQVWPPTRSSQACSGVLRRRKFRAVKGGGKTCHFAGAEQDGVGDDSDLAAARRLRVGDRA